MARGRARQVRYLADDPEPRDFLLEQVFYLPIELGDADGALRGACLEQIVHRDSILRAPGRGRAGFLSDPAFTRKWAPRRIDRLTSRKQ